MTYPKIPHAPLKNLVTPVIEPHPAPTWSRTFDRYAEPEEFAYYGLLPRIADHIADVIYRMRDGRELASYGNALSASLGQVPLPDGCYMGIVGYLATGRPLAVLDAKFARNHGTGYLTQLTKHDPAFAELVLQGLTAGLTVLRLERIERQSRRDSSEAATILSIIKLVEDELRWVVGAAQRPAPDTEGADDSSKSKAKHVGTSSWADGGSARASAPSVIERAMAELDAARA